MVPARVTPQAGASRFWLMFGGIWLAVGIAFLAIGAFVGWQQLDLDERLQREGRIAEGIVVAKHRRGGGSSSEAPAYRVEFRFNAPAGDAITGSANVDAKTWDALAEGAPLSVRFAHGAPQLHRIAGETSERLLLASIFGALGVALSTLGGFIVWRAASQRAFARRMVHEGVPAQAEVTEVQPCGYRINRVQQWQVRYRYHDHLGRLHEGKSPAMAPELAQRWKLGDRAEIRYQRDRAQRSIFVDRG